MDKLTSFCFAGQHQGAETGLYDNRFRYYDPDSGNYLSQDPIGLAGGNPTIYGYVKDVNTWVDVLGLECKKASNLPLIEPGTKAWKQAVKDIKNSVGHSNNYRVKNQKIAKQLLDEAKPKTMHSKPHPKGTKKTPYRHEYHRQIEGPMKDTGLNHDLEHIKWTDYRKTNSDGHIFYDKWE